MGLVDYEYLIFVGGGGEADAFFEVTNLIYAAVTRRIEFYHIQGSASVNLFTGKTFIARFSLFAEGLIFASGFAVSDFGQEPGGCGFAGASRAGEEIGMAQFASFGGISEDLHNQILAYNIG